MQIWKLGSQAFGFVLSRLFLGFIWIYRYFLSAIFGGQCRYHPTCSAYGKECFETLPFLVAFKLVVRRILNCHPWGGHGYDPVPRVETRDKDVRSAAH